ncbi:predicted protein [Lichtheimia corymbifera JMRC:FSU:9682]|uniref:Uncharacterized protein n=1 Tax=Lichtheimia corymbifera JMRC:FSU:9682 TaxID=1263082 RepID=A0A068RP95_9FUNG|nr:predicted protein [Lichtheimia corymbifera JMRC:FSU:9682]
MQDRLFMQLGSGKFRSPDVDCITKYNEMPFTFCVGHGSFTLMASEKTRLSNVTFIRYLLTCAVRMLSLTVIIMCYATRRLPQQAYHLSWIPDACDCLTSLHRQSITTLVDIPHSATSKRLARIYNSAYKFQAATARWTLRKRAIGMEMTTGNEKESWCSRGQKTAAFTSTG